MKDGGGQAALVLTGGGARAAYQVGVLAAIRELRGRRGGNPFPILCGTSAGGINAAALAVYSSSFNHAVDPDRVHLAPFSRSTRFTRAGPVALLGSMGALGAR